MSRFETSSARHNKTQWATKESFARDPGPRSSILEQRNTYPLTSDFAIFAYRISAFAVALGLRQCGENEEIEDMIGRARFEVPIVRLDRSLLAHCNGILLDEKKSHAGLTGTGQEILS